MITTFVTELEIDSATKLDIAQLLLVAFPEVNYNNRHFFKQLPHYRLLLKEDNRLVGQMGIDFRVMCLNGELVTVLGVIDLAVHPDFQGKGLGTKLMKEFDKIASNHHYNIDFAFLVTDKPGFYTRLGYKPTEITTSWLKLDQGRNYGVGHEKITDSIFMFKQINSKVWRDGELDLLGYMY